MKIPIPHRLMISLAHSRRALLAFGLVWLLTACGGGGGGSAGDSGQGSTGSQSDTTSPTVTVSSPTDGSTVLATVTVSADASDNVGVTGVEFILDDNVLLGEATAAPYTISWDTTTATGGSHTLVAIARDAAGNFSSSATVTVVVGNAIGDNTALLAWDANVEPDVAGYRVYYGTSPGSYDQAKGNGTIVESGTSYLVADLTSGVRYYFTVTAYDTSGNESDYATEVFKDIP